MISSRPYLIRAIYEWIVDNELTPYFLVNAEAADVTIPGQYVQDGRIILNVSPQAVRDLDLSNDWVMFNARFGGVSMEVSVPPSAVLAVYAKENGRGMVFSDDDEVLDEGTGSEPPDDHPPEPPEPPVPSGKGRPSLRVVK
ncbi:MAG TPA: ClpXP protease specificity-enhancing factor [Candidatus Tenderia electrophaga]|uniref:ClpXP protease specificity-enhancing factor n=1 Tax=Candidatus Tenderia electrophaga TaxID=1748243 RepID=A0A832J2Q4_9GAMM|nr:ClpXP protease specificity-enhancing factor [Candidatus Tenderia electrophaga]